MDERQNRFYTNLLALSVHGNKNSLFKACVHVETVMERERYVLSIGSEFEEGKA